MKKWFKWFTESNRSLGLAIGMEFKDYQYNKNWDWLDWSCTVVGGMIGQILTILLLSL